MGAPFLPKAISLSASPQAPTLLASFLIPPLPQLFFLLRALLAMPLLRALLSSLRCCSMLFLAIMDSTNMDVVMAQEQQEEISVEETANFVPDESASSENRNKSLLKSIYWQYFSRYKEEKEWKAKCNHCKSVLGANPRNGTTNLKKHLPHYCKRIKLANSRQSTIAKFL
ncbi:uncharacterized protein LOC110268344 [Arachis ipaensis]|uniref:uncharacterized protein LOC110268344 n=1 Tax=Arachis ipaensis TaxID=130454 RepID=UPI000A2B7D35|nr:uncharacterized protein LOC110268344 [Arachis ipaensis]XP_029152399.1 uncharacterized protein LOC114926109 [Arachis hypogaea]